MLIVKRPELYIVSLQLLVNLPLAFFFSFLFFSCCGFLGSLPFFFSNAVCFCLLPCCLSVDDILFGDTFPVGILPFSWPRDSQIPVNVGDPGYNPLFPYGFSIHVNGDIDSDGLTDRWEALHALDPYDDGSVNPDNGAAGNPDDDEGDNLYEFYTGTHPQRAESIFRIMQVQSVLLSNQPSIHVTSSTVPGYQYGIDYADALGTSVTWNAFANPSNGVGTWIESGNAETNFTFVDDFTPATSGSAPAGGHRFYRVRSTAP